MNKRSLRSFAFGLFAASSIIGAYTVYTGSQKADTDKQITTEQAEKVLSAKGFTTVANEDYEELVAAKEQAEKAAQQAKADKKAAETEEAKQAETEKADEPISYKLKIKSGMSPGEIADTLTKEKIIKDKDEFEAFLIDNDYHTKVQVGTFRVYSDMSFREIAEKITK
ncbi:MULTISPECIES: hypothetical protein [Bacillaceae]|uniref:hypothetical protein n=1 Tax=Bacillaceae TaxID=186817 RepID=UPI001E3531F8|nr:MULTISPECIES: hypothetical protein [Bacillaceae]MCE4047043.1 hypothetical protein [Bacillus sp. Au-Bac7]MCM3030147.1 hypothetical protein [Niallia sp. MER 6]MDL0436596.1 hypothetical protein [Niallia sp. SS-2023]UPO86574.1 hypothetical protein L8T27_013355 [Niallia sp. Man26]